MNYKKIDSKDVEFLISILDKSRVFTGEAINDDFSHDEIGGIMINMSRMNKILELDEENLTLTLEPGVLLMEISKYVEEFDLFYPPDPGEKSATIAGNVIQMQVE